VGTSVAAFIGQAPQKDAHLHEPISVNNWSEFIKHFAPKATVGNDLSNAVYLYFLNGGSRCWIVNIGTDKTIGGDGKGVDSLSVIDDVALVAAPGMTDGASYDALLTHAETMQDRVAILDGPEKAAKVERLIRVAEDATAGDEGKTADSGLRARASKRGYGAYYFPWIKTRDPFNPTELIAVPPSGAVAGICARTDAQRGVHKAPANETVRGALGLSQMISKNDQEQLNPNGVNCLRMFSREGVLVYGARTLADSASEWRYLNVRRLFNMIEESILRSTNWVVFEPNDRPLWKAITRDVSAFLTLIWRQGALMGSTPEEAFFVKCDEETNTQDVIDAGQVVTIVGIAPVKPAEFVVFEIGQSADGASVETV
jgi:phage tail sheath protein FI